MIAYLFVSDPEQVAAEARHFVERGFRTIKLKIGVDERSDVPIVKAVREAVGPDIRIRADVNGAWTPGTAKRMISRLAPFDLEYVEQPLVHDDLLGHAQLRLWSPVPIALDESAYTTTDVLNIIRAEAADVILLDPHEAGGLWQARKAASICEAAGIPVTLHSGDPTFRWRTRVLDGGVPTPCSIDAEHVPCHRRTTTQPDRRCCSRSRGVPVRPLLFHGPQWPGAWHVSGRGQTCSQCNRDDSRSVSGRAMSGMVRRKTRLLTLEPTVQLARVRSGVGGHVMQTPKESK